MNDPHSSEPVRLEPRDIRELEEILGSLVDYLRRFGGDAAAPGPAEEPAAEPQDDWGQAAPEDETISVFPQASPPWAAQTPQPHIPTAQPVYPTAQPAAAPVGVGLEEVLFGRDFPADAEVDGGRSELIRHLMSGDDDAATLVGNLLIFRAAQADRASQLLKEVGEAWYRWRPFSGASDPMLAALVEWLQNSCEKQGVQHRIELVHPGDRFDSARHHARQRGVEVAEVQGWVVLRDNGRVYTKAGVTLR